VNVAPSTIQALRKLYWRRVSQLTLGLLTIWLLVAVGVPWFARELNQWHIGRFSLGFWLNAQGAILIFVALIVVYAWIMDRLDRWYLRRLAALEVTPVFEPGAGQ
jgi:putative solute:sodium symporter small subunit